MAADDAERIKDEPVPAGTPLQPAFLLGWRREFWTL